MAEKNYYDILGITDEERKLPDKEFEDVCKKKYRKLKQNEDILNSYLIQGISNVDTIKGSHLEKRFIDKFSLRCRKYQEKIYDYKSLVDKEIFIK